MIEYYASTWRRGITFRWIAPLLGVAIASGGIAAAQQPASIAASDRPTVTSSAQSSLPVESASPPAFSPPNAAVLGAPNPVPNTAYEALLQSSPFTRTLNLSDSLILTGYARLDDTPIATLLNKKTNETFVVTDKPNRQGWRMLEINIDEGMDRAEAKLSIGSGQVVTVRFDGEVMAEIAKRSRRSGPGSGSGGKEQKGSSKGGPSSDMRDKFMKMNEGQRQKFRDYMSKNREKLSKMSGEERMKHIQEVLTKVVK